MHARASANTGASPEDLKEALLHVAVYAGVPAANEALPHRSGGPGGERPAAAGGGRRRTMSERPDMPAGGNRPPQVAPLIERDLSRHPPALAPAYKTSVLRAPQRPPVAFEATLSETSGPVFGPQALGAAGPRPAAQLRRDRRADRAAHPGARPPARQRPAAGCRAR